MNNPHEHQETDPIFEGKVKQAVSLLERENLKTFIDELEEQHAQNQGGTVRQMIPRKWLSIAASLLILVAAVFIFNKLQPPSSDLLVEQYYEPFPNSVDPLTRSEQKKVTVQRLGLQAYEAKEYKLALDYFNEMIELNDDVRICKAISYFELNENDKAKAGLQMVIDNQGRRVRDAQWYMGLILLKEGYIDQAKTYFEGLANGPADSSYQRKATIILQAL